MVRLTTLFVVFVANFLKLKNHTKSQIDDVFIINLKTMSTTCYLHYVQQVDIYNDRRIHGVKICDDYV